VYLMEVATKEPVITEEFKGFMKICQDEAEEIGMQVRVNAEEPDQFTLARNFGAKGAGLVRQEHMVFGDALSVFQNLIVNIKNAELRKKYLAEMLPILVKSFEEIFIAMDGLPTTVRLLDPPLHEFLPKEAELKKQNMGLKKFRMLMKVMEALREMNPMLGNRGARLLIVYKDLAAMLVKSIFEGACNALAKGIEVCPEIMVPLIGTVKEYTILRDIVNATAQQVFSEHGYTIEYSVGAMVETPAAALIAGKLAEVCDFLSFGTNDLTQLTLGISRDDVGSFLEAYLEEGIWLANPFVTLHPEVAELVLLAVERARDANPAIKIGVCGEHGGDIESIKTFVQAGCNYVSCSAPTVPAAFLGCAQAAIADTPDWKDGMYPEVLPTVA
jgi:pyruvate,orthophosphate dikinase